MHGGCRLRQPWFPSGAHLPAVPPGPPAMALWAFPGLRGALRRRKGHPPAGAVPVYAIRSMVELANECRWEFRQTATPPPEPNAPRPEAVKAPGAWKSPPRGSPLLRPHRKAPSPFSVITPPTPSNPIHTALEPSSCRLAPRSCRSAVSRCPCGGPDHRSRMIPSGTSV